MSGRNLCFSLLPHFFIIYQLSLLVSLNFPVTCFLHPLVCIPYYKEWLHSYQLNWCLLIFFQGSTEYPLLYEAFLNFSKPHHYSPALKLSVLLVWHFLAFISFWPLYNFFYWTVLCHYTIGTHKNFYKKPPSQKHYQIYGRCWGHGFLHFTVSFPHGPMGKMFLCPQNQE